MAVFTSHEALLAAMKNLREATFDRVEFFSPFRIDEAAALVGRTKNPVRLWTLIGAMSGCIGGFWLAIGSAAVNNLVVGAKFTPVAYIPYCIVGFEGTILLGVLGNLAGMLFHSRLGRLQLPAGYNGRFTQDRFGLLVKCAPQQVDEVKSLLSLANAEAVNVIA